MNQPSPRRVDKNIGLVVDRSLPDDRVIVGALVVMMADDGTYTAHVVNTADGHQVPMPQLDTLEAIGGLLADAWAINRL